ncbi:acyltransferase family protein [Pseudomonas sp. L-22-4S-12]|nr:acyltransferase family protein [Pseudomonas sp. L-22-4S-12]
MTRMRGRITDLEMMRAVGLLFVLLQHLVLLFPWPYPALNGLLQYVGGSFGVDMFFALSGFLIARDLLPRLRAAESPSSTSKILVNFWWKRIWRLWPTAWLWLAIILLAVLFWNQSGVFGSWDANVAATCASLFKYMNFRFAEYYGVGEVGASFVYWSLSLEEQFYFAFPLLAILLRRNLTWLLIVLIVLQMFQPKTTALAMAFRTEALAFGVLIAIASEKAWWQRGASLLQRLGSVGGMLLGLSCVAIMAAVSGLRQPTFYHMSFIAPLSALLVAVASYNMDMLTVRGPLKTPLLWLASRSYGIYIIHIPVFLFVKELFYRLEYFQTFSLQAVLAYMLLALPLVLVLADANFRIIERPLLRYGTALISRRRSIMAAVGRAA